VMITDSTGSIVNVYNYDDFGNIISSTETIPNDYTCTGKQIDRESGLYYYGARYYDASAGLFICKDPKFSLRSLKIPIKINRYLYVINNPLKWIDIWGRDESDRDDQDDNPIDPDGPDPYDEDDDAKDPGGPDPIDPDDYAPDDDSGYGGEREAAPDDDGPSSDPNAPWWSD